jgi:hypothetical protein
MSINLDELYKEFCIIKPTLALFLNDKAEQTLSDSGKWCQIVLAADSGLADAARFLLFVPSVPGCSAYVEKGFSLMNCCGRHERNNSSVNLIKHEIAVKMNCK